MLHLKLRKKVSVSGPITGAADTGIRLAMNASPASPPATVQASAEPDNIFEMKPDGAFAAPKWKTKDW